MKLLKKIILPVLMALSLCTLASCSYSASDLSANLDESTKEEYGIAGMEDIEGTSFERQGYSITFQSTADQFDYNTTLVYEYLSVHYPETLCYVVSKKTKFLGADYVVDYSLSKSSHYSLDGNAMSYVFAYSLTDTVTDKGTLEDGCMITLYFNDSEEERETHRSYMDLNKNNSTFTLKN